MVSEVWQRLLRLFFRSQEEREMDEELRFHIDKETEKNLAGGMSATEARRRAHVRLGGVERVKAETREAWGIRSLQTLLMDFKIAGRGLLRTPVQTVAAIVAYPPPQRGACVQHVHYWEVVRRAIRRQEYQQVAQCHHSVLETATAIMERTMNRLPVVDVSLHRLLDVNGDRAPIQSQIRTKHRVQADAMRVRHIMGQGRHEPRVLHVSQMLLVVLHCRGCCCHCC